MQAIRLGGLFDKQGKRHQAGSIWDKRYLSPTIDTCGGGYREPLIVEMCEGDEDKMNYWLSDRMKKYIISNDDAYNVGRNGLIVNRKIACTKTTREGNTRAETSDYISPDLPLNANISNLTSDEIIKLIIRKITPDEAWKLMGFDFEDCAKARKSINDKFYKGKDRANSQLYKQAGNSIVVDVLYHLFKQMCDE